MEIYKNTPFLFFGIFALLGVFFVLECHSFSLCLTLLCFFYMARKNLSLVPLASLFFIFFALYTYSLKKSDIKPTEGTALLKIQQCRTRTLNNKTFLCLEVKILSFSENEVPKNLTASMLLQATHKLPALNYLYEIKGTLKTTQKGTLIFSPQKNVDWIQKNKIFSLAQLRYSMAQTLKTLLDTHIRDSQSKILLEGLALGSFEDPDLRYLLSCFGLNHLLAISGFHFTFLSLCLENILLHLLSWRKRHLTIVMIMGLYFCFLGLAPSIFRAFIMTALHFIAPIIGRKYSAINSLGIALTLQLLIEPQSIYSLGFIFSYSTTLSLLFSASSMSTLLAHLIPHRSFQEIQQASLFDKHCFIILHTLRKGLSLSLSVTLVSLPLCLYFFKSFPWLSLIYNLFFPPLIFLMMLGLIGGCLLCLTPISMIFFNLTGKITSFALSLLHICPPSLIFYLRTPSPPKEIIILYFICLLLFFEKKQSDLDFKPNLSDHF